MRSIAYVVSHLRHVFWARRRSVPEHRPGDFSLTFADLLASSSFPESTDLLMEHLRQLEDRRVADDFDTVHDSRRRVSALSDLHRAQGSSDVTESRGRQLRHYYGQGNV
jgi:hypothetical protein